MTPLRPWRSLKRTSFFDVGKCGLKTRQLPLWGAACISILFIVYRTAVYQLRQTEIEGPFMGFGMLRGAGESDDNSEMLRGLPRGIIGANADLELKPLWSRGNSRLQAVTSTPSQRYLLAIPAGITQKDNVDAIVQKFLPENFTVILFHYDGKLDGWWDLKWSSKAIHIVAHNQTKWWFAKRFLHPAVVSIYDYIFLWDEDLGVENFDPGRYLKIVRTEGLEISQPALDPNSTDVHHRITVRSRSKIVHRRVYDTRGSTRCSESSMGPPCTGFVEGMAPVFSRSAWYCAWHLIQNDLVHGWGMDMKLGYCAQGDRTRKVGIVDREYIVHKGIQTLGGAGIPERKSKRRSKRHSIQMDPRMEIRRQSTWELKVFKERWEKAVKADRQWIDRYKQDRRQLDKIRRN